MGTTTEKLTYLQGTKDAIKNAIVAKGVEVPEGTTFRGYAEKIGEIQAGGEKVTGNIDYTMMTIVYIEDNEVKKLEFSSGVIKVNKGSMLNIFGQIGSLLEIPEAEGGAELKQNLGDRYNFNAFYLITGDFTIKDRV